MLKHLCFWLFFILASNIAMAEDGDVRILVSDSILVVDANENMFVYCDKNKRITINDLLSESDYYPFEKIGPTAPNYGYEDADYWFKIHVRNESEDDKNWLLHINNPLIDSIQVFSMIGDSIVHFQMTGDLFPYHRRYIQHPSFLFPIDFEGQKEITLMVLVQGNDNKSFPIQVIEQKYFEAKSRNLIMFFGIYFGVITALILYNLFVYFSTRSRIYFYYSLFVFFVLVIHLSLNGYTYAYFLTSWTNIANASNLIAIGISTFFGAKFIKDFLELKSRGKALNYFLLINEINGIVLFGLCLIAIHVPAIFLSTVKFAFYTTIFFSISVFIIGIILSISGSRQAKFLMVAWTILLVGITITALKFSGLIPDNLVTHHAALIGSMIEVLLLSLALADRLKTLEQERDRERDEKIFVLEERDKIISQQNVLLEEKVIARTEQLENQKAKLREKTKALEASLSALMKKNKLVEALLKELNHRVKNNLQVISSLLNLQANRISDPIAAEALRHGKNRINSIAMIHKKLYQKDEIEKINLAEYISDLFEYMMGLYWSQKDIEIEKEIPDILINIDTAIPLGLILNEILTNTFKYAFECAKVKPKITIAIQQNGNLLQIVFSDNGVGLPASVLHGGESNFGFELIETLVEQLNGGFTFYNDKGTNIEVYINLVEHGE